MPPLPLLSSLVATSVILASLLPSVANANAESQQIDRFIEDAIRRKGTESNAPSTDEEFLRRLYLDIIGRIPTAEEAHAFLDVEAPNKRVLLINQLLDSEGYISHNFHWWADLLRAVGGNEGAYTSFIKSALRENMPYDEFVRELINPSVPDPKTGERVTGRPAFQWDNGSVGYYMRDRGMPLDNMSATLQVFLGTRLVCAQCHDHPFDEWSQMDYHKMAAFTYNTLTTRVNPTTVLGLDKKIDRKTRRKGGRYYRDALNTLLRPISYGIMPTERTLKLPHDYRSAKDPAEPFTEVKPATMFGSKVRGRGSRLLDNYAKWMTSPDNPRFTKVIANRLWKRVMGRGLVEPVDEWTEQTEPSNRYVLDYLERLIVTNDYNLKEVLRTLYNTRTYQRQAYGDDIPEDEAYLFPGPILRRMSAEQYWDSFMTIAVPDIDERPGKRGRDRYARYKSQATALLSANKADILRLVDDITELNREAGESTEIIRKRITEAEDRPAIKKLQRELRAINNVRNEKVQTLISEKLGSGTYEMMNMETAASQGEKAPARWRGYPRGFVRASELESPAKKGHFLRQFGQSDRETIDAASTEPSVDQALTLLNSDIFESMFKENSKLVQDLAKAKTAKERQDTLFLGLLSRYPTERDRTLMNAQIAKDGEDAGFRNVAWALVNTQEFRFLQ